MCICSLLHLLMLQLGLNFYNIIHRPTSRDKTNKEEKLPDIQPVFSVRLDGL